MGGVEEGGSACVREEEGVCVGGFVRRCSLDGNLESYPGGVDVGVWVRGWYWGGEG